MRGTSKENRSGFGPADFISADGTVRGYISEWCDDNSVICDVYSNITDELEESAAKIPLEELKNVNWYVKAVEGDPEENYIERRTLAHDMVKAFAHGLKADPAAITWINPKEDLPDNSTMRILFALKEPGYLCMDEGNAMVGYYAPDTEEFVESPSDLSRTKYFYGVNEVQCWMPYPYPISFEKE